MICNIDIETMPQQGAYDEFLAEARDNFKAPSLLTKTIAVKDLELSAADAKSLGKDDAIAMWVERFSSEKAPAVADENWRRTALDGAKGELFSIAVAVADLEPKCFARTLTAGMFSSEADMLLRFFEYTANICRGRPPFFVGQFVAGFDLKFIYQRCVINRVRPLFGLPFDGRHGKDFYDTQIGWAGFKGRASQDSICKALGIEGKPDDIDGSKVWDFIVAGKTDRVIEYNIDDVEKNREIYKRLNFIDKVGADRADRADRAENPLLEGMGAMGSR